ncbi:hypothetical protein [Mesorhizobium sp. M1B.F.Ca.ET.045.04.1.1]|uniref:hypothetical protein n=1 Tax=Mesorhizobium sp. M1B.F.Ca.ET.045.04.1.1 TaxID=2493673 RepID=UPI000F761D81|nr:hypothetical protein [Mesorhizobium sp. M1B.F.Ca.ET.045.04.1.1]AZO29356.1 hypothetical protein EJ071_19515 [Mesorhizobium sp. M1B.F.Ca.ET.045.04.1.1]
MPTIEEIADKHGGLPIEPAKPLKTFSLLFAWSDNDKEQGEYGTVVRAESYDDAEAKGRADMRENHISNHCDADADEDEIAESCAEYEHTDLYGNIVFGGRLIEAHVGAIWKAAELETALRDIITSSDANDSGSLMNAIEAGRAIIAEIDAIA